MTTTPKATPKKNAMGREIVQPPEVKKKVYKLSLTIGKETFDSVGETMAEALDKLEKPAKLMAKSVLTITVDGNSRELHMHPARAKRLFFNSAGVRQVLAKSLEFGLMK